MGMTALANPCGELIYNKHGKLRKYQILPLDIFENTKKNGISTTSGATTESSTAASDPGVSTGASVSWKQSTSTNGPCKWGGLFATQEHYFDYIAQNLDLIKKEMALGQGGHLEILASAHNCQGIGMASFPKTMQKELVQFIDYTPEQARQFESTLNSVISTHLSNVCQLGT